MTDELIDPTVFDELADAMGEDFAEELLTAFLTDAQDMFKELRQSLATEDTVSYKRAAHSIKSNAQTFGATKLTNEARAMELSETMAADAVSSLSTTFDATAHALKGLLDD